jgi:N-acetylglucosamine-6-phosphate deacetylase
MGAVALARQAFLDAQWYRSAWQAAENLSSLPRPEHNQALEALVQCIDSKSDFVIDTFNEQSSLRADQFAREFGLKVILRGSGREYRMLDAIAKTRRPIIVPVNFPKAPNVATIEDAAQASLQDLAHWELAPENPGRLAKAKVEIALTSFGLDDPEKMLAQVRLAIQRGLDEDAALNALTMRPAQWFGVDSIAGSLEPGKLASFLVTDGRLWDKKTKITETWVDGARFEWDQPPVSDLRGEWELQLVSGKGEATQWKLSVLGDKRGKATLSAREQPSQESESERPPSPPEASNRKGTSVDLKQLSIRDYRLSAVFDPKNLPLQGAKTESPATPPGTTASEAGPAQLSLAAFDDAENPTELMGQLRWHDGQTTSLRAKRIKSTSDKSTSDKPTESAPADKPTPPSSNIATVTFPLGEYGRSGLPQASPWVLFRRATLWTCGPAGTMTGADVLIHDGKIHSVGKDIQAPEGAIVVDASGKHISPGIIDCHSHMATDGGVNESGQAVTAEVRIGDFIDANDIHIYYQLAGGVTIANVLHGSANPIGGQNQVIKLRWGGAYDDLKMKEAPAGIKFALGENVKQSNWGPEATGRYPQSRMGVEQIMRDRFEAAIQYQQRWRNWNETAQGLPPRRDLELEAISQILQGQRWIHCHSYRQDEILAMLRTLEEYRVTIGSLQHILEGYKVAEAMARNGAMGSSFSDWWGYKFEVIDAIPHNGALMHNMGIVVSFNSDDNELGRHLNHEAAKAVKYGGVPPDEALKFVTLNPAKQLRIEAFTGSLEPGKQADLVVWSGPPLSVLSRCLQTWIDGRKYFDVDQDRLDREHIAKSRQRLIQKILESDVPMGAAGEKPFDPSLLWPRHDEFCHDHHHEDDLHHHDLRDQAQGHE